MQLRRAAIDDVWRFCAARKWQPPSGEYRLLVSEARAGRMWCGTSDEGEPLALGGVIRPAPGLPGTCWLSVVPGLGGRLVPVALGMRTVIRHEARDAPSGLVCVVSDDNARGARLARALGFSPTDRTVFRLREWRLSWRV